MVVVILKKCTPQFADTYSLMTLPFSTSAYLDKGVIVFKIAVKWSKFLVDFL